jgi:hypothetical protein
MQETILKNGRQYRSHPVGVRCRPGQNRVTWCSAQTQTRIGLLEEIPRSGVQIPCLYYWAT